MNTDKMKEEYWRKRNKHLQKKPMFHKNIIETSR